MRRGSLPVCREGSREGLDVYIGVRYAHSEIQAIAELGLASDELCVLYVP